MTLFSFRMAATATSCKPCLRIKDDWCGGNLKSDNQLCYFQKVLSKPVKLLRYFTNRQRILNVIAAAKILCKYAVQ